MSPYAEGPFQFLETPAGFLYEGGTSELFGSLPAIKKRDLATLALDSEVEVSTDSGVRIETTTSGGGSIFITDDEGDITKFNASSFTQEAKNTSFFIRSSPSTDGEATWLPQLGYNGDLYLFDIGINTLLRLNSDDLSVTASIDGDTLSKVFPGAGFPLVNFIDLTVTPDAVYLAAAEPNNDETSGLGGNDALLMLSIYKLDVDTLAEQSRWTIDEGVDLTVNGTTARRIHTDETAQIDGSVKLVHDQNGFLFLSAQQLSFVEGAPGGAGRNMYSRSAEILRLDVGTNSITHVSNLALEAGLAEDTFAQVEHCVGDNGFLYATAFFHFFEGSNTTLELSLNTLSVEKEVFGERLWRLIYSPESKLYGLFTYETQFGSERTDLLLVDIASGMEEARITDSDAESLTLDKSLPVILPFP